MSFFRGNHVCTIYKPLALSSLEVALHDSEVCCKSGRTTTEINDAIYEPMRLQVHPPKEKASTGGAMLPASTVQALSRGKRLQYSRGNDRGW